MPRLCCDCGGAIHAHAKERCRDCYDRAVKIGGKVCRRNPDTVPHEHDVTLWLQMDAAFCKAMTRAIDRGLEHPPIGTCKTPGTQYPRNRSAA